MQCSSPVPETVPLISVVGDSLWSWRAAPADHSCPVFSIAIQVPRRRQRLPSHLAVGLTEVQVILMQRAEFRDGVVICRGGCRKEMRQVPPDGMCERGGQEGCGGPCCSFFRKKLSCLLLEKKNKMKSKALLQSLDLYWPRLLGLSLDIELLLGPQVF